MIVNYKHDDTVNHNGKTINYTVVYYDNGITQYVFNEQLTNEEQKNIIDYITLYPFIV